MRRTVLGLTAAVWYDTIFERLTDLNNNELEMGCSWRKERRAKVRSRDTVQLSLVRRATAAECFSGIPAEFAENIGASRWPRLPEAMLDL